MHIVPSERQKKAKALPIGLMNVYTFALMGRTWLGGSMFTCAYAHTETRERHEILPQLTKTCAAVVFIDVCTYVSDVYMLIYVHARLQNACT